MNNIGEVNKNGHGECRPNILHWGEIKQWNTREDKQAWEIQYVRTKQVR